MREVFWALARSHPTLLPGEDERPTAEALTFGTFLAMTSADRGGYQDAADLCQTALEYMAVLPAWCEAHLEADTPRCKQDGDRYVP
jgi:hypothetical protein